MICVFCAVAENAVSTLSDAALYELYREEFDALEHNYVEQQTAIRALNVENALTEPQAVSTTIQDGENAVVTFPSVIEKISDLKQAREIGGIDSTEYYTCARIYIRTEYETKSINGRGSVRFYRGIGRVLNYYDGFSGNGVVVTYGHSGSGSYSTTYTLLSSQSYDFESYHDKWVYDYTSSKVGQSARYAFRRPTSTSDTVVYVDCHYNP